MLSVVDKNKGAWNMCEECNFLVESVLSFGHGVIRHWKLYFSKLMGRGLTCHEGMGDGPLVIIMKIVECHTGSLVHYFICRL